MSKKQSRITIDEKRQEVYENGKRVHLPKSEYVLLSLLKRTGRTHSREEIMNEIDPVADYLGNRAVDQYVTRLRKKFKTPVIETVCGFGYKLAKNFLG